ncbi:cation transport regulator ChaB [Candidatus Woesearchaeota archaeon]|nr:cation transport regulator ChaB [Candidatus Woesearchaeota archaeon]
MPYKANKHLPKRVKDNLPRGAQTIFRKAYNNAEKQYKDPKKRRGKASLTAVCNKVAWSAVKNEYKKKGGDWVKK